MHDTAKKVSPEAPIYVMEIIGTNRSGPEICKQRHSFWSFSWDKQMRILTRINKDLAGIPSCAVRNPLVPFQYLYSNICWINKCVWHNSVLAVQVSIISVWTKDVECTVCAQSVFLPVSIFNVQLRVYSTYRTCVPIHWNSVHLRKMGYLKCSLWAYVFCP